MRFIHGFITLIAAIAVLIFAGSWVAEKYGIGPDLGIFDAIEEEADPYAYIYQRAQIPVKDRAKLSVPVQFMKGPSWMDGGRESPVVPVLMGPPKYWGGEFSSFSGQDGAKVMDGGGCSLPTVNLLRLDAEIGKRVAVFDRRVFVPAYAYYEDDSEGLIFALVVDEDSNQDEFYSCEDDAKMQIISPTDGSAKIIERTVSLSDLSRIDFEWENQQFTFIEREQTEDKISQRTIKISLTGEVVVEEEFPDLLLEAKAAFERTKSE